MPLYDFECEPCAYYTEIRQGMGDPSVHDCPVCGQNTLKKVFINAPAIFVRGEPQTIGGLADRNTSKMGTYELQDKERKDRSNGLTEEQKAKRERHQKITSMTPEQTTHWIKSGEGL